MPGTDRTDRIPSFLSALLVAATAVTLAGCGATTTSATSSVTPTPTATPDVAAARTTALTIFFPAPGQTREVWLPCSARAANFVDCPFSAAVIAGLNHMTSSGFGGDATRCGEEFITGPHKGLNTAPLGVSAAPDSNGQVTAFTLPGA